MVPDSARRTSSGRTRRVGALALTTALAMSCGALIATPAVAAIDGSGVVINEAYLSGGSAGAAFKNKFVELYNPTETDISLDGMSVQYRSATGTGSFNGVAELSGTIPAGGYYLVQGGSNGTNGIDLPATDAASGALNPSGTTGTLALVEGTTAVSLTPGSVVGVDGVVDLLGYGSSNTFEGAVATAPESTRDVKSLNRSAGSDTDVNADDFSLSESITPQNSGGASQPEDPENPEDPEDPEEPTAATIAEVQGTEDEAAMNGQNVTVEGVITADHRTGGYDGIVIQTEGSGGEDDATPGASDGIFVYLNGKTVPGAIGDVVTVTGSVSEYYGQTQISPAAADDVAVITAGAGVPAVTPLPESVVGADREAYENMLVAPAGTYRVASSHQLYNFGTLWLNPGELNVKSTETTRPGDEANAIAAENRAERILLDDGYNVQVSNNAHPGDQPYFTEDVTV
ncbi:MAG: lamin tail domain-containing protein, partial [Microbacterium sp.]